MLKISDLTRLRLRAFCGGRVLSSMHKVALSEILAWNTLLNPKSCWRRRGSEELMSDDEPSLEVRVHGSRLRAQGLGFEV